MSKNQKITEALAAHIRNGADALRAIEAVFGAGAYENIAGMIYDMHREVAA